MATKSGTQGIMSDSAGDTRLALYVVAARVGALVLSQGLKAIVERARPVFDAPTSRPMVRCSSLTRPWSAA